MILFPGAVLGYYRAKRCLSSGEKSNYGRIIKNTGFLTLIIMIVFCIVSAMIALNDPYTGENLKSMFHLKSTIPEDALVIFIISGGIFLSAVQYFLTIAIMRIKVDKIN